MQQIQEFKSHLLKAQTKSLGQDY